MEGICECAIATCTKGESIFEYRLKFDHAVDKQTVEEFIHTEYPKFTNYTIYQESDNDTDALHDTWMMRLVNELNITREPIRIGGTEGIFHSKEVVPMSN